MLRDKNILTGGVKGDNIVSDYLVKWSSPEQHSFLVISVVLFEKKTIASNDFMTKNDISVNCTNELASQRKLIQVG